MTEEHKDQEKPYKAPLQKLKEGLLLRYDQKQVSEPGYYAIGTLSDEAKILQKQWQYANEILRIIGELKLTIWQLNHLPSEDELSELEMGPEDTVLYYEGIFPELTHQLKDKMLGLIELLLGIKPLTKKTGKRVNQILKQAKEIGIDLETELNAWHARDENRGIKEIIKDVLILRTNHHHYLSRIPLNSFYHDVKVSRLFSKDPLKNQLTELGRTKIDRMGREGFESLKEQAKQKMSSTLEEIKKNTASIANKLINHFGLEYKPEVLLEYSKKRQELSERLEIKNSTSIENVSKKLRTEMDECFLRCLSGTEELLSSFYLVGSMARGEFDPLFSDINLVIVVKDLDTKNLLLEHLPTKLGISAQFFTEEEFLQKDNLAARKIRFICKYDGVLIAGKDVILKEVFPKPGAELAWILNHDFLKKMSVIEQWAKEHADASMEMVGRKSKEVLKLFFDAVYGAAITNDPQYTHNRRQRIDFIDAAFPENQEVMKIYKKIFFSGGIGNLDGLVALIEKTKDVWLVIDTQIKPIVDKLYETTGGESEKKSEEVE